MRELVIKDLLITRLFWLPAAFSDLVFLLMFYEASWMMFLVGVLLAMAFSAGVLLIDDVHRTDALIGALPVTRQDIVRARFLTTGIIAGVCLVLFAVGTTGIVALLDERAVHLAPLLSARTGLAFLGLVGLSASVFLPFYFRYGLGRAALRFLIVVLGSSVAVVAAGPGRVTDFVSKAWTALGDAAAAAAAAAFVALSVFVSLRLSIRVYSRRDF